MIKILILSFIGLLAFSCSQINTKSKAHYKQKNMRHGIVPLTIDSVSLKTMESSKAKPFKLTYDEKLATKGKRVYDKYCFSCHGKNGDGNGPLAKSQERKPADLNKMVKSVPNFKFYISVSQWTGDMPGWQKMLSDKDIKEVTHYIKKLSLKK